MSAGHCLRSRTLKGDDLMKILISGYNTTKEMIESIMESGDDIQVICEDNVVKAADMACAELFDMLFFMEDIAENPTISPKARRSFPVKTLFIGMQNGNPDSTKNSEAFINHMCRSLDERNNLTILKNGNLYAAYDPIGSMWSSYTSINQCMAAVMKRAKFLLKTHRVGCVNMGTAENLNTMNKAALSEFAEYAITAATVFQEKIPHKGAKFLGNASMRDKENGNIAWMSKRGVDKEALGANSFVPTMMSGDIRIMPDGNISDNKVWFWCDDNKTKPSRDAAVQLVLYNKLQNINYMIHSHCYVNDAVFTKTAIPCGAIEEASEVLSIIDDMPKSGFYAINLIGHGCIIMAETLDELKKAEFITREHPELMR